MLRGPLPFISSGSPAARLSGFNTNYRITASLENHLQLLQATSLILWAWMRLSWSWRYFMSHQKKLLHFLLRADLWDEMAESPLCRWLGGFQLPKLSRRQEVTCSTAGKVCPTGYNQIPHKGGKCFISCWSHWRPTDTVLLPTPVFPVKPVWHQQELRTSNSAALQTDHPKPGGVLHLHDHVSLFLSVLFYFRSLRFWILALPCVHIFHFLPLDSFIFCWIVFLFYLLFLFP